MVGNTPLERLSRGLHAMDTLALLTRPLTLRPDGPTRLSRILPGPMEGVMTPWFCRAAAELDLIPGWVTPFFRLSDNLPRRSKFARFLAPFLDSGKPVVLQLMGNRPELLADAARTAADHFPLAGIDLNFACPSPTVLRSHSGGALLRQPDQMQDIVAAVRAAIPHLPLSVKLRTGFASDREMETYIPRLAAEGLDLIAVHFRTVGEVYRETPGRSERLTRAVALAGNVPVFGSGDVYSTADAATILSCGCAGVMAARGWLRDPELLRRLQHPDHGLDSTSEDDREAGRRRFFLALREQARGEMPNQPRPGLTGLAAFMWGTDSPFFRRLLKFDDQAFWIGSLPEA